MGPESYPEPASESSGYWQYPNYEYDTRYLSHHGCTAASASLSATSSSYCSSAGDGPHADLADTGYEDRMAGGFKHGFSRYSTDLLYLASVITSMNNAQDSVMHQAQYENPHSSSSASTAQSMSLMLVQDQPPPPRPPTSDTSIPSWPRRVAKACSSCRRDKIRCDGGRPCSSCCKKGYEIAKCNDGCSPCRKARKQCDGNIPCSRCAGMKLSCHEDRNSPIPPSYPPPIAAAQNTRQRQPQRIKAACQACRKDNKKCGDQRPCNRCQLRGEECVQLTRNVRSVKRRCAACRRENKKCEDDRPCNHCRESGHDCIDVPRKGRGHGTRVKAACINCRRDKIQCGLDRPCKSCTRRGLDCSDRTCRCSSKGEGADCFICRSQINTRRELAQSSSQHENTHAETNESCEDENYPNQQPEQISPPVSPTRAQQVSSMSLTVRPQYINASYHMMPSLSEDFEQPSDESQSLTRAENVSQQYNAIAQAASMQSRAPMIQYSEAELQQHALLLAQIQMAMSTSQQQTQLYLSEHEQDFYTNQGANLENNQDGKGDFDVGDSLAYGPTMYSPAPMQ